MNLCMKSDYENHHCNVSWLYSSLYIIASHTFNSTLIIVIPHHIRQSSSHFIQNNFTHKLDSTLIIIKLVCPVMSHISMSHVTHMNESYHTHMNESCHAYEWATSHIWTCHVTRMKVSVTHKGGGGGVPPSPETCAWGITHIEFTRIVRGYETRVYVTSLHICDMTHSHMPQVIHMWDRTHSSSIVGSSGIHEIAATHCNTLQHTATHCNTLNHTATHCNTLQHTLDRKSVV